MCELIKVAIYLEVKEISKGVEIKNEEKDFTEETVMRKKKIMNQNIHHRIRLGRDKLGTKPHRRVTCWTKTYI